MASFKSFLSQLGHAAKKVVDIFVPVEQAAAPFLNIFAPGVGTALNLATAVVVNVEQKFAAQGNSSGTGAQKLAEALAILGPAMQQLLAQEGIKADQTNITAIINAIVAGLNAIPAIQTAVTTPAAPATPAPAK